MSKATITLIVIVLVVMLVVFPIMFLPHVVAMISGQEPVSLRGIEAGVGIFVLPLLVIVLAVLLRQSGRRMKALMQQIRTQNGGAITFPTRLFPATLPAVNQLRQLSFPSLPPISSRALHPAVEVARGSISIWRAAAPAERVLTISSRAIVTADYHLVKVPVSPTSKQLSDFPSLGLTIELNGTRVLLLLPIMKMTSLVLKEDAEIVRPKVLEIAEMLGLAPSNKARGSDWTTSS